MDTLTKRLEKHPHIKAQLEALLDVAENNSGEFERADDAEAAIIEGVRQMGKNTLQEWAIVQNVKKEMAAREKQSLKCHSKKNFIGKQPLEK